MRLVSEACSTSEYAQGLGTLGAPHMRCVVRRSGGHVGGEGAEGNVPHRLSMAPAR